LQGIGWKNGNPFYLIMPDTFNQWNCNLLLLGIWQAMVDLLHIDQGQWGEFLH
jgi:hypothetical protein